MPCAYTFLIYNISMDETLYLQEFSEIYSRLMQLEITMKRRIISSLLSYYQEDIIDVFEKFFFNKTRLKRYDNKSGNSWLSILKNPQIKSNSQKFIKLVNSMYLSDILFIVLCCEQFRKIEIMEKFYVQKPEKFGKLVKGRHILLDLRNTIAHYNIRCYKQNKNEYLEVLKLFENYIL